MRRINTRRTHNKWTGIAVVLSVAAIGKEDWLPTFLAAAGEPN